MRRFYLADVDTSKVVAYGIEFPHGESAVWWPKVGAAVYPSSTVAAWGWRREWLDTDVDPDYWNGPELLAVVGATVQAAARFVDQIERTS